jgi:hypothetical protein
MIADQRNPLQFRKPLCMKKDEQITFTIRPTEYALPGAATKVVGSQYFVNFVLVGSRSLL